MLKVNIFLRFHLVMGRLNIQGLCLLTYGNLLQTMQTLNIQPQASNQVDIDLERQILPD